MRAGKTGQQAHTVDFAQDLQSENRVLVAVSGIS